ncbi:MAG: SpoIIE family protein phosphatase [Bryobacteraceae bacterium]
MRRKSTRILYFLLFVWALISMSYYIAGATALREEWFHGERNARAPFDLSDDGQTLMQVQKEAKNAGLSDGDVLLSLNGKPFTGWFQSNNIFRRARPGDTAEVSARAKDGRMKEARVRLAPSEGPGFTLGGYIAFLSPILGVPLLGLIIGYWVVAARPRDPNAWLVLWLLTVTETLFGNLDTSFWGGTWFIVFLVWHSIIQNFDFAALVWFGIYFPERWRMDRRWPWVKWLILAESLCVFAASLWINGARFFDVRRMPALVGFERWADRIDGWAETICIILFLAAVFDKLRSASTQDAKRRLRVLAIRSGLSLGPLWIMFAVLPHLGIDPHHGSWFEVAVPLVVLFPLTLAYVVIVQRAMDVRILLRMGTKYLLAKATLLIVEIAVAAFLVLRFIVPMMERKEHQLLNVILLVAIIAVLFRVFLVRDSLTSRLQRWLDRKFFREAYNSEIVLSELSEQTRQFTDKGPLIETVSRRISEVLHVPRIAVWLRGSNVFHLQQAVGIDLMGPVMLPEESATVQNLARTNRPATVYRDRPEDWFLTTGEEERKTLDRVSAELLLPLPGRERLMGLMALGPKKSEEPYTPTDLRVLQSLAAQTGLALEVSELAQSLAKEAAQRERVNREMEIAREVQQRLFPQQLPSIAGLSLAGMCRPALGVGGDYYDLIELEDGRLGIAIGDVSGKGISAALLMASLRASLRGMTLDAPSDLARMMQKVNQLVYEASAANRYATFFFATYNPATRELRYVNAGHNPPMLIGRGAADVQRLEAGGLVVGLMPRANYEEQSIVFKRGDVLLTYTDGISEAMTVDDEEWGEERMLAAAQAAQNEPAGEILQAIFRAADDFTAAAPQHDDMTLLIMKLD